MFGADIGDLFIESAPGTNAMSASGWSTLWSVSGQQQTDGAGSWSHAVQDWGPNVDTVVRIRGHTGTDYHSDICLDDVTVRGAVSAGAGAAGWTIHGPQQADGPADWAQLSVDWVPSVDTVARIRGHTGSDYHSDMAIDDVHVSGAVSLGGAAAAHVPTWPIECAANFACNSISGGWEYDGVCLARTEISSLPADPGNPPAGCTAFIPTRSWARSDWDAICQHFLAPMGSPCNQPDVDADGGRCPINTEGDPFLAMSEQISGSDMQVASDAWAWDPNGGTSDGCNYHAFGSNPLSVIWACGSAGSGGVPPAPPAPAGQGWVMQSTDTFCVSAHNNIRHYYL